MRMPLNYQVGTLITVISEKNKIDRIQKLNG
jgi:hypothetical protein